MSDHIKVEVSGGVMTITFDRPAKKNALSLAMYDALTAALERAQAEEAVRVVLFQGAGEVFTAGNDLADFAQVAVGAATPMNALAFLEKLSRMEKPVVAAVHGLAVGIGMTLLLHCDLVYVAGDAKLSVPFVNLALAPEAASSLLLTSRIGHVRAFAMFTLGEAITGKEAASLGLAVAAYPTSEVKGRALAAARALAAKPPGSLKVTKRLMRDVEAVVVRMREEGQIFSQRLRTAEAAEAFQAFVERRPPDFTKL